MITVGSWVVVTDQPVPVWRRVIAVGVARRGMTAFPDQPAPAIAAGDEHQRLERDDRHIERRAIEKGWLFRCGSSPETLNVSPLESPTSVQSTSALRASGCR